MGKLRFMKKGHFVKKRYLGLCAVLLAFFLCGVQARAAGAEYSTTEEGVTVTLTTDKDSYKSGEEIHYTILIENNRKGWSIKSSDVSYRNSDGIEAASEDSMPADVPQIAYGESYELSGTLVGDAETYPATGPSVGLIVGIVVGAVVLLVIVVLLIVVLKKKKGKKAAASALLLIATSGILCGVAAWGLPALASSNDYETVTVRPYVTVSYAGQTINVRAVINFTMDMDLVTLASEDRDTATTITCHDPSIFKDFDGTYYIFGSFLAGGYTSDLRNWTSIDSTFQASFSQEVIDQIRAWNDDDSAGNWNDYLWAPDIIYNTAMGKYCMYLSANGDNWKSNIVLLVSDAVDGPYEYAGTIVYGGFSEDDYAETDAPLVLGESTIPDRYVTYGVKNKRWGDMYPNCIDPCVFYDDDGNLWISYGSWSGGIFMLELDEETGLRDYSVTYETNEHSDAYFGTKIAGGAYVSGEASYIQKIGDYYYLFISYGNLEAAGGYNIRVFRSERPDGDYVDALGNTPYYDTYVFNYNDGIGVRLFGGYKWRQFNNGQVAQGHNSAFVDDDGSAYIVFHTRTTNGTEGHYVKVHQLFVNKEGWLVAAPYQYYGERLSENGYDVSEVAGEYELIIHSLAIDYANLETNKPEFITLTEDGKITGAYEGTWSLEEGTPYITLTFDDVNYSGVTLYMTAEYSNVEVMTFTALGIENQITIWGSKSIYEE